MNRSSYYSMKLVENGQILTDGPESLKDQQIVPEQRNPHYKYIKEGKSEIPPYFLHHFQASSSSSLRKNSLPDRHRSTSANFCFFKPQDDGWKSSEKPKFKVENLVPNLETGEEFRRDELSAAHGVTDRENFNANRDKRSSIIKQLVVPCCSMASREASNDLTYTRNYTYQETEESDDLSYDNYDEETEETDDEISLHENKGGKRKRTTENNELSEKEREEKLNKKLKALEELIPNCNKLDKALMLDDAIDYLRSLQLQHQMMSMGNNIRMSQMMLPLGMPQMDVPPFPHYPLFGLGLDTYMRMPMVGAGCNPAQFLTSPLYGAPALAGMNEATNIFGFSGYAVPMQSVFPAAAPAQLPNFNYLPNSNDQTQINFFSGCR